MTFTKLVKCQKVNILSALSSFKTMFIHVVSYVIAASWAPSGKDSGSVPELKGAIWFSYNESIKAPAILHKAMRLDQESMAR